MKGSARRLPVLLSIPLLFIAHGYSDATVATIGVSGNNDALAAPTPKVQLAPPTGVTATVSGTPVTVAWNAVANATSYTVPRCS